MDLKITEKKEEPLLSRTRITAEISFDAVTPSNKDVKAKIASALKANENIVVIKNIKVLFGKKEAKVIGYQYEDEKKLKLIEPKVKVKKKKEEQAKEEPKK